MATGKTTHQHVAAADIAHHVATKLAEIGQRFTSGRKSIVEVLTHAQRPLSIPEILQHTTGLPQSSVYRNLTVLENAGVVVRVITTDEWARFELTEDLTGHHHHMVCSVCGSVDDVRIPDRIEDELDAALMKVAAKAGFNMAHHRLDVVGVCQACQ